VQDLSYCTTQELIAELMRRHTFCGAVIHSVDEQKQDVWAEERVFRVHFSQSLDAHRTSRLLSTVADYMNCSFG
jgi:hypothetical protein